MKIGLFIGKAQTGIAGTGTGYIPEPGSGGSSSSSGFGNGGGGFRVEDLSKALVCLSDKVHMYYKFHMRMLVVRKYI